MLTATQQMEVALAEQRRHVIAVAKAEERERIAKIIEALDNTMMNQTTLAAHIRTRV